MTKKSQICFLRGLIQFVLFARFFASLGLAWAPGVTKTPNIIDFLMKKIRALFIVFPLHDLALMQAACSTELAAEPHSGTRHCRIHFQNFSSMLYILHALWQASMSHY